MDNYQGSVLILGGTADARELTEQLCRQDIKVIYSIAGMVRVPAVDCEVVSGGFSQYGGLSEYIAQKNIIAIVDATHPYAKIISTTAVAAAKAGDIPCWRFQRPPWQPELGDNWHEFDDWEHLLTPLAEKNSVFFTAGQLPGSVISTLETNAAQSLQYQLLRTAIKPSHKLLPTMRWIKAIGPFNYQSERSIMKSRCIDVLVSKNSGGQATVAKLAAARSLGIAVFMLKRPSLPDADQTFSTVAECYSFIIQYFTQRAFIVPGISNAL